MAWLFSATSGAWLLLLGGLSLLTWGVAAQFGRPVGAMVLGLLLLWAGMRAAREL